jgi:hypothetical protein
VPPATHRPKTLSLAELASDDSHQLKVILAEGHNPVRRSPPRVSAALNGHEPVHDLKALARGVEVYDSHQDVVDDHHVSPCAGRCDGRLLNARWTLRGRTHSLTRGKPQIFNAEPVWRLSSGIPGGSQPGLPFRLGSGNGEGAGGPVAPLRKPAPRRAPTSRPRSARQRRRSEPRRASDRKCRSVLIRPTP